MVTRKQIQLLHKIRDVCDQAPRNSYASEVTIQIVKYYDELKHITADEFLIHTGFTKGYRSYFYQYIKWTPRLVKAGLDVNKL